MRNKKADLPISANNNLSSNRHRLRDGKYGQR